MRVKCLVLERSFPRVFSMVLLNLFGTQFVSGVPCHPRPTTVGGSETSMGPSVPHVL